MHIYIFFFFSHLYFPASGQADVTGVVPSPPRFLPSIFIAHSVSSLCFGEMLVSEPVITCHPTIPHVSAVLPLWVRVSIDADTYKDLRNSNNLDTNTSLVYTFTSTDEGAQKIIFRHLRTIFFFLPSRGGRGVRRPHALPITPHNFLCKEPPF